MLVADLPALVLAPMEGVTDAPMRALIGELAPFTYAISEFLRVAHAVPPKGVLLRHIPELTTAARTLTDLPVQVQLLGGDPGRLADTAHLAVAEGATAIDLNFGCPARTVNRHDGGATLLRYPARIRAIVRAVRDAVPAHLPVSAKVRLGWDSIDAIDANADMVAEGGASWLTIHGRTRMVGYAPPIFWEPIGRVRRRLGIPVVANGDIWTLDDFRRCRDLTGCTHYMLGRGALADPSLPAQVAAELGLPTTVPRPIEPGDWHALLTRLIAWTVRLVALPPERMVRRLKQWLNLASSRGTFADFDTVKRAETLEELLTGVRANRIPALAGG